MNCAEPKARLLVNKHKKNMQDFYWKQMKEEHDWPDTYSFPIINS